MNRFYGKIGYGGTVETSPGVWRDSIIETNYYGEQVKTISKWNTSGYANDNREYSTQISILTDENAYNNWYNIKYIEYQGALWEVTSVEPLRPRLLLTIGGIWNGEQTRIADGT